MSQANPPDRATIEVAGAQPGPPSLVAGAGLWWRFLPRLAPWLILTLGCSLTCWGWVTMKRSHEAMSEQRFQSLTQTVMEGLSKRVQRIDRVLSGCRGLYAASKSVERDEWRNYVASLDLEEHPGALGLGFIRYVPPGELTTFLHETRADGAPGFTPHHLSTNETHLLVTFIEPLARNHTAEGLDITDDLPCRDAARQAMRTGNGTLTRRIELVQDNRKLSGFMYLLPVYRNQMPAGTPTERAQAIFGWVYAPIRIDVMVANIRREVQSLVNFEVSERDPAGGLSAIYDDDELLNSATKGAAPSPAAAHQRVAVASLSMAGQEWNVRVSTRPAFHEQLSQSETRMLLAAGVGLTALLAGWVRSLVNRARQVERLVGERTAAARLADANLQRAVAELAQQKSVLDQHAIVAVTDVQGGILYANEKFCQISQYTSEELRSQNHRLIKSGRHPAEFFREMYRVLGRGGTWHGEMQNRAKDGSLYWVEATVAPFAGPDGRPERFIAICTDITARKKLEEELRRREEQAPSARPNSPLGTDRASAPPASSGPKDI